MQYRIYTSHTVQQNEWEEHIKHFPVHLYRFYTPTDSSPPTYIQLLYMFIVFNLEKKPISTQPNSMVQVAKHPSQLRFLAPKELEEAGFKIYHWPKPNYILEAFWRKGNFLFHLERQCFLNPKLPWDESNVALPQTNMSSTRSTFAKGCQWFQNSLDMFLPVGSKKVYILEQIIPFSKYHFFQILSNHCFVKKHQKEKHDIGPGIFNCPVPFLFPEERCNPL